MRTKQYYRDLVKECFRSMSLAERKKRSRKLVENLVENPVFRRAKTVMAYEPMEDEVDIGEIFGEKKEFVVPKMKKGEIVVADNLDLIIVPGRAFTWGGARIGRGRGDYDRFLAGLPNKVPTVSLVFDFQVFDELPVEEHDISIDTVIVV